MGNNGSGLSLPEMKEVWAKNEWVKKGGYADMAKLMSRIPNISNYEKEAVRFL